ncbi:MAG: hypothetical protein JJU00_02680 [Opitutales bacterium]|nr:hypothetical protein [Opitutales bacterium]
MKRPPLRFTFVLACLAAVLGEARESVRSLDLPNGVSLEARSTSEGWFLGLGGFALGGYPLAHDETVVFPLIADEWAEQPVIGAGLRLARAKAVGGGWDLHVEIFGSTDFADWKKYFAWDEEDIFWEGEQGGPARDKFRFARTRPLAEITRASHRSAFLDERAAAFEKMGVLIWRIRAHEDTIAGWPWRGWSGSIEIHLDAPHRTTALRLLGGAEVGGTLDGLTLANQRYRGLGNLEQPLDTDTTGRSATTYNTQDTFSRPSPLPPGFTDGHSAALSREAALGLRADSWIHAPARGAGTSFFDYQFNERAAFVAYPDRQGNLRGLTEIYPGDGGVGQISEEHFAYTDNQITQPMFYAALVREEPAGVHFWRTRYLEIEYELRARVAAELGFLADRVVPSVGYLFDFWGANDNFASVTARMADYAGHLHQLGVQRVMVHNPGWVNGRAANRGWDGGDQFEFTGGGVNKIYDWWPLPEVEDPWRQASVIYDKLGIENYTWITGMTHRDAPFVREVGLDPENWALNSPSGPPNETYGEDAYKHNILSPRFREVFDQRLRGVRESFGYAGFWGDSFQNLMMGQLDWATRDGEPMQRAYWEWLAAQSREGVGWISESHSFPGLSCSIETDNALETPWMMAHTSHWLRGNAQFERSPREWGNLAFRAMAHNAWLAPEIWPYYAHAEVDPTNVIDGFARLARQFRAALPFMQRPWLLPENGGVLWLSDEHPGKGVFYAFRRQSVPEGITAAEILNHTGQTTGTFFPNQTYRLEGDGLTGIVDRFGLELPPHEDRRTPITYRPLTTNLPEGEPVWTWKQDPGSMQAPAWSTGGSGWIDASGSPAEWPGIDAPHAFFEPGTRTFLNIGGHVRAAGIHVPTTGVAFIIDTVRGGEPGDILEVSGPLTGPVDIFFKNTYREQGLIQSPRRAETGLRFTGGGQYGVSANLLPWPQDYHRHSQIVSLGDPGTTVHFRGSWPATGELSRPGLVLGEGTRFVIWPEADFPFIKNYGGFTLQLWVSGDDEGGGILELHHDFIADRSRDALAPFAPRGRDLALGSLGSIRVSGATLRTHDGRSLPMTGRALHDEADGVQNNGHIVFERRDGNRWEIRTRDQSYRGAVWIDADTTIDTDRNFTHRGINESPDAKFNYTAANAFQTRRLRNGKEGPITIRKEGRAALILAGEQAYVENSRLHIAAGRVVFASDPAAGGQFPHGTESAGPNLEITVESGAVLEVAYPSAVVSKVQLHEGASLHWTKPGLVNVAASARLDGEIHPLPGLTEPTVLLEAAVIKGRPTLADNPGRLEIRDHNGRQQLLYHPEE